MVQLCQNHWKTIDGNGGLKKNINHSIALKNWPSLWSTLHWSLIYANTEGCSAPASSGRRLNALSPDLRLFLPKQKRQLEGERLPAGWRGSWRRREGSTGWQACRGQDRRGEQDAIQCLNLYFPRISSAFLCFLFAHNFYKLSQHSLKNVIRRIIDICRTSLYANQQSLLTLCPM